MLDLAPKIAKEERKGEIFLCLFVFCNFTVIKIILATTAMVDGVCRCAFIIRKVSSVFINKI